MIYIRPRVYCTYGAELGKRFVKTDTPFSYRGSTHAEWQQVTQVFGWIWRSVGPPFRDRTDLFMEVL